MERGRGGRRGYRGGRDEYWGRGRGRGGRKHEDPDYTPTILTNPSRPQVVDDDEEEWPSLGPQSATASPAHVRKEVAASLVPGTVRIQASTSGKQTPPVSQPEVMRSEPPVRKPTVGSSQKAAQQEDAWNNLSSGGVQMISEGLDWLDNPAEFLMEQNTEFLVIGVIGPQGAGKSTLLSMIGGNDPYDMYRQYIFRPASREAAESCKHQTCGVQMYVTKTRTILLDCQPCSSHAILDDLLRGDKRYNYEFKTVENYVEVESLEMAAFILQVSHVVLVVSDWFIDLNLVRFLRAAEMLKPPVSEGDGSITFDRYPNIVFAHHKAKLDDFQVSTVKERCRFIESLFNGSNLNVKCSISLAYSSMAQFSEESLKSLASINYFPFPELKLRGQVDQKSDLPVGTPEYDNLIKDFRHIIRSVPRPPFLSTVTLTEKAWFLFASRMWSEIRKSPLIAEYGRTLH